MNWKREAADKLRRYESVRLAVKNLEAELRRLEEASRTIRPVRPDLVTVDRTVGRKEDHLLDNLVCQQELTVVLKDAKNWLAIMERALETVRPDERMLLKKFYISSGSEPIEALCNQMGVEKSSIYRRKDQALRNFTQALYGPVEA
mgnify:CR=1 FL=1